MTIEVGTAPRVSPDERTAALKAILESARSGTGEASMIRTLLASAKLSPDQAVLVDALMELAEDEDAEPAAVVYEDDHEEPRTGTRQDRDPTAGSPLFRLRREVADLREANDTLASAVGACPVCWGGDSECPICDGRGSPGYATPDPALFREFVLPAVKKVRDMGQGPARSRRG